jgi:GNAT superfamily N-acetyltransferase
MSDTSVRLVSIADQARVFAVLLLAFARDPVERWLFPEPDQYLQEFPEFLRAFGGDAFDRKAVWALGDFSAVALWLPPGVEPNGGAIVDALATSVLPDRQADTMLALDQMGRAHPTFAHWYLPWLGVDPARQGQGLGDRLLKQCLEAVDASHMPAYLETPNPQTIPFYERQGFVVTGATDAGACPPITFMLRKAQ